ncbi:hypothetical protein [Pseudoduganella sp. HUAS MS19]
MSSYSCVIPVDWRLLWEDVIPAWLSLLAGSMTPAEFYARYLPAGDMYGDLFDDRYAAPAEYLSLFPAPLCPPYSRAKFHEYPEYSGYCEAPDSSSYMLEEAIKQSAAVTLMGYDPYAGDYCASTDARFMARQVAGTKNQYTFLETAFEVNWCQETSHYSYTRREKGTSAQLQELFELLFLYQRLIPGVWSPSESPMWPGYDDLSFAGYLSPGEVTRLWDELTRWESRGVVEDELFPLFSDRVKRASESGCGLLTIYAGL